ncbi:MAG: hypothetical protein AAFY59_06575 [Pseudomonadota bacterium]
MSLSVRTGFVVSGGSFNSMFGVADIVSFSLDGQPYIAVGSEATGGVSVLSVGGGVAVEVSGISYSEGSGTSTLSDLALVDAAGGPRLMALGRYDDNYGLFDVSAGGALTMNAPLSDGAGTLERGLISATANFLDYTMVYSAQFGRVGVYAHRLYADGSIEHMRTYEGGWARLNDVTTLEFAVLHGQNFLFSGSAISTGVTAFDVFARGMPQITGRFLPRDGDGINGITDIEAVQHGDRAFVVVGSSQTHSLSVLRVSTAGEMNQVEYLLDTRFTRFGGVTEVEIIEADDRVFVVAGGADDGISILEMDYRGQLQHLTSIADGFDTTLANVSALDIRVEGTEAHIYVGSASDHGVTELVVDLDRTGSDIRGGAVPDTLIGTDADDILWGMGRSDVLQGGAGDDRLVDGRGRDTLTGGAGADVFEFVADGRNDFITDFDFARDRIDLSAFEHLYHISDLTIGPRLTGAAILVGDEVIRLLSADGGPIDTSQFTQDHFIFG